MLEVLAVAGQPLRASQAGMAAASREEPRSAILALRSNHLIRASAHDGGPSKNALVEPPTDSATQRLSFSSGALTYSAA